MTNELPEGGRLKQLLSLVFSSSGAWAAAIILLSGAFFSALPSYLPLARSLEVWSRDIRIAAVTPPEPQSEDIIIISLTDETLDLPQFPYRLPVDRTFLAGLVRHLESSGVRAIGIDILLDRWTEEAKDADLMEVLHNATIPVLPIWGDENVGVEGLRLEILEQFVGDAPTGFGLLLHDRADGTVRIHRPIWAEAEEEGDITLSFPAAIAAALGYETPDESHHIAWRGRPNEETMPFRHYPAHFVPVLPSEWFEGKIALIGVDLVDIDRHRTPMQIRARTREDIQRLTPAELRRRYGRIPGIEVHAHVLSQIIGGRFITETPDAIRVLIILIMAALGMIIAAPNRPLWMKLIVAGVFTVAYIATIVMTYRWSLIMLPVIMPGMALLVSAAMTTVLVGRQERAKRAYIRSAFSKYVSPAVVARLDKDPDQLVLGGERREVTFMFTDLAGFTSMSESLTPSELADIINEYLDGVGEAVLRHGGTIDKFIGDGMMSFFGAPESFDDDPDRAVACAMDLDQFSEEFGKKWRAQGVPVGMTRIGIHTGPAIVGNFGGQDRFDYTALGDVVNAASRLEGANKEFGTRILVSDETRRMTENATYRPVGDIVLVGKDEAIVSFQPLADHEIGSKRVSLYNKNFELIKNQDPKAQDAFRAYVASYPDDVLGQYHLKRLERGETGTRIVLTSK